jgi:hypothetical protein
MTIALLGCIFLMAPFVSLWKRELFVFFVLLIASQLLGLIHEFDFGFAGYFDINAIIVILSGFAIGMSANRLREIRGSVLAKYFIPIVILWIYGTMGPYWRGHSSLFYSIKYSKQFLSYISYFAVFLFLRNQKQVDRSWKFIGWLAVYLSVFEIAGICTRGYVFSLFQYDYRPEPPIFYKVYPPVYTVMIIAFLQVLYELLFNKKRTGRAWVFYVVNSLGILFTFFRSYYLALCAAIPLVLAMKGSLGKAAKSAVLIGVVVGVSTLGIAGISSKNLGLGDAFDSFIGSGVRELVHHTGGSLVGRDIVSQGRMAIAHERYWMGWGFIDKDSEMGRRMGRRLGRGLGLGAVGGVDTGMIDKGYLDVEMKFGMIGLVVLYGTMSFLGLRLVRLLRSVDDIKFQARIFAAAAFVFILIIVQYVHASLTYQFAVLPLSIILGLIDRESMLLRKRTKSSEAPPVTGGSK